MPNFLLSLDNHPMEVDISESLFILEEEGYPYPESFGGLVKTQITVFLRTLSPTEFITLSVE